ncbi:MAG: hypothetical protein JNL08_15020 [Planctomycetes bacterium]|nr:hypothetical protein [Planctomycetota bacterium]
MKTAAKSRPSSERVARGPASRPAWRCLGWVGALVLCLVLASTGMPAAGAGITDGTCIAVHHDHASRARSGAAVAAATPAIRPDIAAASAAPPRLPPRARTIEAGGLPPPRAPTV